MSYREKILALDFDGVLHPGDDKIHFDRDARMPIWQFEIAMKAQGRFVWLPILEDALRDCDLSIVVHSTWRRFFSDSDFRHLLGPELGSRLINLDGQIENRLNSNADEYLMQVIDFVQPLDVCVLDDRPEFFSDGQVAAWIAANAGELIWTSPQTGLSNPTVNAQLGLWAHTPVDGSRLAPLQCLATPSVS